jgi:hypothetical protein
MDRATRTLLGGGAVLAPALHTLTDLMEFAGGGFSAVQLGMNYGAFVAMPFVLIGLYAIQKPSMGTDGLVGALAYGVAFVYFAGTTMYAIAYPISDYATLLQELGVIYTAHGVLMVFGGTLFGSAVVRAGIFPRWTGLALILGVAINVLVAAVAVPPILQGIGGGFRNLAFVAMGVVVLRGEPEHRQRAV